MLTPQIALFRFLKLIIIGIITAVLFGAIELAFAPLLASLNFSPNLSAFLVAVSVMVAAGVINNLDLLSTSLISKEEYPNKSRSIWASTLNHIFLGIFMLPWIGGLLVRETPSEYLWLVVGLYIVVMRVGNGFWEVLYSTSPTRTLKVYGELGTLLTLGLSMYFFSGNLPASIGPVHLAVLIVIWQLLEFVWEHGLGLIYYGFNQFYGVTFLHDFPIPKTPQSPLDAEIEELESEELVE